MFLRLLAVSRARDRSPPSAARETVRNHLGTLGFESNLRALQLLLSGHDLGTIPVTSVLRVPAGNLALEARAPGYLPAYESLSVAPRSEQRTALVPAPPEPPTETLPAAGSTLTRAGNQTISEPHWTAASARSSAADSGAG
jgi:hypothetical protein